MDIQLVYFIGALLLAGAGAGFSAGLFGIGGGSVMVPVLYYVFAAVGYSTDVIMHMAVATSSAVIIIASIRSVRTHNKHGAVDWEILWPDNKLKSWGLWIGAGALLGALVIAKFLSGDMLTLLFGSVMVLISMQFIFGRPDWRLRDTMPGGLAFPVIGGGIGALSALMGIGGGSLSVTFMSVCGKSIHRAIGTASGVGMFISIPATIGYVFSGLGVDGRAPLSLGYVNLLGFVAVAATSIAFIPLGAKLAHNTDQKRLKLIFGLFFLLVSMNMIRKVIV